MKECSKCGEMKSQGEFHKDNNRPDKLTSNCKICRNTAFRAYRQRNRQKGKIIPINVRCPSCNQMKESESFYKDASAKNGLQTYCKQCVVKPSHEKACEYTKKWQDKNKGIIKVFVDNKVCSKCKIDKSIDDFSQDKYTIDGYTHQCKKCRAENTRRYRNTEQGRQKTRDYDRKRYEEDECYRVSCNISRAIQKVLKEENSSKNGSSIWNHLPYTSQQLKEHLENLFEDWMTWKNYGKASIYRRTWHIDHVIPQSKLRFDSMEHENFSKCWSLKNLRPLEAVENIRKGAKV